MDTERSGEMDVPFQLSEPVPASAGAGKVRATSGVFRANRSGAVCRSYKFVVSLGDNEADSIELSGELASKLPLSEVTTLQILIAGGTNNSAYWDWPIDPDKNSYVKHATDQGFATLNLDRPGYGKSDRPDPLRTDFAVQAEAMQQVVQSLRDGSLGHRFQKIVINGHSMGGMVAWRTASAHRCVDAVIVSGVGHNLPDIAMKLVLEGVEPIEGHPRYGEGMGWPKGYFARKFNPALFQIPEASIASFFEDTVMDAELQAIYTDSRTQGITENIQCPALFALGEYDTRWCTETGVCSTDPAYLNEPQHYDPATDFTSFIIPGSGHSNATDGGTEFFAEQVGKWLHDRGM